MIETDLFDFAYVPDWYGQLDELSKLALPEPWRFKKPIYKTKNEDTHTGAVHTYCFPKAEH